ncbi:hypothetical protein QFZ58_001529 [Streptomyces sp. B1I3]|nr:hypothetical protein [Streptomyces sp. B1I3]
MALTDTAPTPLAPFVRAAYGTLRAPDGARTRQVWTARV